MPDATTTRPGTMAVYAGTFDMPTEGHFWMIRTARLLFDPLVVAVGINPDKRTMFTVEERLRMLSDGVQGPGVEFDTFENQYLANYAAARGAKVIVRGIRNEGDYAYERAMRYVNEDFRPGLTTVFLMPPRELAEVSSSFVKGLVGPDGWQDKVRRYVPEPVFQMIAARVAARTGK